MLALFFSRKYNRLLHGISYTASYICPRSMYKPDGSRADISRSKANIGCGIKKMPCHDFNIIHLYKISKKQSKTSCDE